MARWSKQCPPAATERSQNLQLSRLRSLARLPRGEPPPRIEPRRPPGTHDDLWVRPGSARARLQNRLAERAEVQLVNAILHQPLLGTAALLDPIEHPEHEPRVWSDVVCGEPGELLQVGRRGGRRSTTEPMPAAVRRWSATIVSRSAPSAARSRAAIMPVRSLPAAQKKSAGIAPGATNLPMASTTRPGPWSR